MEADDFVRQLRLFGFGPEGCADQQGAQDGKDPPPGDLMLKAM